MVTFQLNSRDGTIAKMTSHFKVVILLCALISFVTSAKYYEQYKAYDFTVSSFEFVEKLARWQETEGVDFWKFGAPGVESRVMISPDNVDEFEKFLVSENIPFEIRSENVGDIEEEFQKDQLKRVERARARKLANPAATHPGWDIYWTSDEIDRFGDYLARTYPQFVTREVAARSFEGRDIVALKISSGGFGGKPVIFMDAGMHAREWVSHATMSYFLHRLIEDPQTRDELLKNVDWIIFPNLNPDGYTESYLNDRMWRKNRNALNASCVGVDLNRNFGFSWRQATLGTCRLSTYSGPGPNSEVETDALLTYMTRYRANIKLYMSVHSFGDMMLWPWGFSGSPGHAENWRAHDAVGNLWADAIRANTGKSYRVGNTADLLGNAFGASDDHMYGDQRVNLVFTLEITGGGRTGFDFPEEEIESLRYETFWGYRAFGLYVSNNY